MTIDEQELGRRLKEAAGLSGAPRFTVAELTRQVARRRARVAAAVSGAVVVVAALAATTTTPLSGSHQTAAGHPSPLPVVLPYTMTVNGQTREFPGQGTRPVYVITPGESLSITVDVAVPARATVTALWLGITTDGIVALRPQGPADMSPILAASTKSPLGPGTHHRFSLHWTAPAALRPGDSRLLSAQWSWLAAWSQGTEEGSIAVLNVTAS